MYSFYGTQDVQAVVPKHVKRRGTIYLSALNFEHIGGMALEIKVKLVTTFYVDY